MSRLRFLLPAAVLVAGVLSTTDPSRASLKYSKSEKRPCVTCHETVKGKDLNKVGKCFQKSHSLADCEPKK